MRGNVVDWGMGRDHLKRVGAASPESWAWWVGTLGYISLAFPSGKRRQGSPPGRGAALARGQPASTGGIPECLGQAEEVHRVGLQYHRHELGAAEGRGGGEAALWVPRSIPPCLGRCSQRPSFPLCACWTVHNTIADQQSLSAFYRKEKQKK